MSPNPYNYNLPVGPEMFYGRQKQLDYAVTQLLAVRGDSIALIGGRRMGKTSFLEALERALRQAIVEQPPDRPLPLPLFIDFTGADVTSAHAFLRCVIQESAGGWPHPDGRLIPGLPDASPGQGPPGHEFRDLLKLWAQQVSDAFHRPPRLILLLDECEHIVNHAWTTGLYRVLRFVLDNASARHLLNVVMAGSHRFHTQVYQAGSPLENILQYHDYRLYAFDRVSAEALIQEPTGQRTPPAVAEAVWAESGGHPFLIQYLMHTLCKGDLAASTPADVVTAAVGFPRGRPDFHKWLDAMGPTAVAAYRTLVEAGVPCSVAAIRARITPADNLEGILEALRYHGLVGGHDDTYWATAGMFRRWFLNNYLPDHPEPPPTPPIATPVPHAPPEVTVRVKISGDGFEPDGPILQRIDRLEGALGDKLDDLRQGQAVIYRHLAPADRAQVEAILAEIRQGRIEQGAVQNTLSAIRDTLLHIKSHGLPVNDPELEQTLADISREIAAAGDLDLQQQLELSLPIIPLLLQYKVTVGSARSLTDIWREIIGQTTPRS